MIKDQFDFDEASPAVRGPDLLDLIQDISIFEDISGFLNGIIAFCVNPSSRNKIEIQILIPKNFTARMLVSGGPGRAG